MLIDVDYSSTRQLSPSTLNLIMAVDYYDDYCVNIVTHFFDNNAQYRRKIVAKSGIRHKARSNSHGKLPPTVSLGLPSIIMRPTCSQHAANMRPTSYHALSFAFCPHPRI